MRVAPLVVFDKLDFVLIDGDLPLRPWSHHSQQVCLPLHQSPCRRGLISHAAAGIVISRKHRLLLIPTQKKSRLFQNYVLEQQNDRGSSRGGNTIGHRGAMTFGDFGLLVHMQHAYTTASCNPAVN